MKTAAFILGVLFACLILYGLYQYKAHNKAWGVKLCLWLCVLAGLVGVGFGARSAVVPILLVGTAVGAFIGWRVCGGKYEGWKLHAMRGLVLGLVCWPFAAIRFCVLREFGYYHEVLMAVEGTELLRFLFYGIPGFLLAGIIAAQVSLIGARGAGPVRKHVKVAHVVLLALLLPCLNWYVAGMVDVHGAVFHGNMMKLKYALRSRPGMIEARDHCWLTPLLEATNQSHVEFVRYLLQAGANVDARDIYNTTVLHYPIDQSDSLEIAKLLLEAWPDINVRDSVFGQTPLAMAVGDNDLELATLLLDHGADPNISDKDGDTPLHQAMTPILVTSVDETRVGFIELLIECGADPNAMDQNGNTPLHRLPFFGGQRAFVKNLLTLFLKAGADVDIQNNEGLSPLSEVVEAELWKAAELMLKHTHKPNTNVSSGESILSMASGLGKVDFVQALIKAGADLNPRNSDDDTPLHLAIGEEHFATADLLIKKGADVHAKNRWRETPLLIASRCATEDDTPKANEALFLKVIRALIKAGADVNEANTNHLAPLHFAIEWKNMEAIELLLKAGADVNVREFLIGFTPADYAKSDGHTEALKLLRKHGGKFSEELDEAESEKEFEHWMKE